MIPTPCAVTLPPWCPVCDNQRVTWAFKPVYVGRPSRWGNPFRFVVNANGVVVMFNGDHRFASHPPTDPDRIATAQRMVVEHYASAIRRGAEGFPSIAHIRRGLAGKDLACWCPLDQPWCHADVLLLISNGDPS